MHALGDCNDDVIRKPAKKQTTITDTFRERKRKSTDNEITQSKEKKKHESALFEKFKNLKESFGKTSKTLKDDLDRSAVRSEKILQEFNYLEKPNSSRAFDKANVTVAPNSVMNDQMQVASTFFEESTKCYENGIVIEDDFMDDSKINDILNEIECEISKENGNTANAGYPNITKDSVSKQSSATPHRPDIIKNVPYQNADSQIDKYKAINSNRKRLNKSVPKKSNYNFIDLLERNVDLSDAEETTIQEQNSFSDAIRSHIEKYLQKAKTNVKPPNTILDFIQNEPAPGKEIEPLIIVHDSKTTDQDDQKTIDETDSKSDQLSTSTVVEDIGFKHTAKHVNALQDRIKSIDLTSDEFLKTDLQPIEELEEENDLPEVKLLGNTTGNTEQSDNVNIQIIEINDNGNSNAVINTSFDEHNITPDNIEPMLVPKETQNEGIKELSEKTEVNEATKHINEQQPIINIAANDYPFQSQKTEIGMFNTNERTDSPKVEQQQVVEIKPLARRPMEQSKMENDQIELTTVSMDTQNITYKCNHDESKENIASPSMSVPESNDKQENRVMDLWKNYIKELPLLSSNSKFSSSSVTLDATRGSENTTASIEPNDVSMNKFNAPNKRNINPDKPVQADTVPSKTKGFIQPFKNTVRDSTIQNHNLVQVALQTPMSLQRQNRTHIHLMNNDFSLEDQNEITTFSSTTCEYNNHSIFNQQNYMIKDPWSRSNTVIIPKLDNPTPSITELKIDNNDNGDIGAHNNEIAINSHPTRISLEMPKRMNFATELYQKPDDEMESLTMKEIKEINNPRISTNANSFPLSQDENSSYTHTNTQNVTQYSFLTNKTYVTTQKTTDHSVRVIRKLKIDLDVTEIISENKKNTGNYTEIKDHKDTNQEGSIVASKKPKLAKTQGIELCASNSDCYRLDPGADISKLQEDSCKSLEFSDAMITEITLPVQDNETKQMEEMEKDECEIDEGNEGDLGTFRKFKMEDSREETKPINVMSILQKYSSIMRNDAKNATNLNTTKVNEKPSRSSKNNKPMRPFKISEIHRLNPTPLPDALIEIRENPDRVNVTECSNLLQLKDKQAKLEKNKQHICKLTIPTPKAHDIEPELGIDRQVAVETYEKLEDIPYCDPLTFVDIEEKNITSNIDQTMFNPKALLQCFSKDEPDIVPPPPEFCDNFNSTALDANNEEQFSMDCYEPTRYEDEVMDVPREDNISIFQDNEQIELTPSNEIETWKLSQEEPSCKLYALTPSPYTFTMMRKIKETAKKSSVQRSSFPRQMLNQFKFNRKKKFK